MFEGWDSFYLLIGGAAGALIGLLFVVATLTRGRDRDSALHGASIYMSPVVLHLALVLTLSALATAPALHLGTAAALIGIGAVIAALASARVVYHLTIGKSFTAPHWTDVWAYGVFPLAADLALAGSALAVWVSDPGVAARGVAASLVAIRNAWDLVTWISASTNTGETPPAEPGQTS